MKGVTRLSVKHMLFDLVFISSFRPDVLDLFYMQVIVAETHQEPQVKASNGTLNGVKEQLHKGHVKVERGERTCCALMRKKKKPTTVQIFQSGAEDGSTRACGLSSLLQGPGSLTYSSLHILFHTACSVATLSLHSTSNNNPCHCIR